MHKITDEKALNQLKKVADKMTPDIRMLSNAVREAKRSLGNPENLSPDVKRWLEVSEKLLAERVYTRNMLNVRSKEIRQLVKR